MKRLLLVLTVTRTAEIRSLAGMVLEGAGHRVIESEGCSQTQSLLSNGLNPDLLLVESSPANPSETSQLRQLLITAPKNSTCLIVGIGEHELRKEASELGIKHFLMKPTTRGDLESMIDELSNFDSPISGSALPHRKCEAPTTTNSPAMPGVPYLEELGENRFFLAASPKMLEILRQVRLLADVEVPVLILGESGTGKEVIAHLIHKHSQRSQERFLNVNCAALPSDLLESELFGYRQGAFTGALRDRPGKFEHANHGTLLLDEIGEISVQMQAKLLHVLQDGQFTRLGGQESTRVDVRILAATNVQIENALLQKTFREDLYYRLSVFTINVPPLRERREEIPYLIEETIRRTPAEMRNSSESGFSSRLIDAALLYDWRGNLRELRNFVTRTIIMRDPDAALRELEAKIAAISGSTNQARPGGALSHSSGMRSIVRDVKDRAEAQMIQETLDASGWNRRHAAQDLNISYRALLYKIQQHRLTPRLPRSLNEAMRSKSNCAQGDDI